MTLEECKIEISKLDNRDKRLSFAQKFLFHGIPYVFENKENDYFDFRNRIANNFNVSFDEVFIVGSAKLGFSYHKWTEFNYNSDIDVVIVNEKLFEKYYLKITRYQYQLDKQYQRVDLQELNTYNSFLQYFVKGWMRPDKLPTSFQINLLKDQWFNFFNSISHDKSEVGNYKVSAGLFKNYNYLEIYYTENIRDVYYKLSKQN